MLGEAALLAFFLFRIFMVDNFERYRNSSVQMLHHLGAKFCPVFLEQDIVRRINGEGNLPSLGKKSHFNRAVNQLISNRYFVFSPTIIAFQQLLSIFIRPRQLHYRTLTVQIHLYLWIDGQIYRRIKLYIVLIIADAKEKQNAGRDCRNPTADPPDGVPLFFRRFFHQHRIVHRLPYFILKIGRL